MLSKSLIKFFQKPQGPPGLSFNQKLKKNPRNYIIIVFKKNIQN